MTKEVQRVLKTGSSYFVISYGRPENRLLHFEREHLDFTTEWGKVYPLDCKTELDKRNKGHFVYTCKKGNDFNTKLENWPEVEADLLIQAKKEAVFDSDDEEDVKQAQELIKEETES
mmetsp:Transcript_13390/g.15025  ORF Transcript_13390/g.15025 Transcript_13390/m.15025 type:complete len:117 (+) Transcript_13390:389-739(+)